MTCIEPDASSTVTFTALLRLTFFSGTRNLGQYSHAYKDLGEVTCAMNKTGTSLSLTPLPTNM